MVLFGAQELNAPPQLNSIPSQTLIDTSVTVQLTGINAGGIDDLGTDSGLDQQPLRIAAASSKPEALKRIDVNYNTPDDRGELTIVRGTPDADELVITVTVTDGGLDGQLETTNDNAEYERSFALSILAGPPLPILRRS